jgi:hypothetical protein
MIKLFIGQQMLKDKGNTVSLPRIYYSRTISRILSSIILFIVVVFFALNIYSRINGAFILLNSTIAEKLNFIINSILSIGVTLVMFIISFLDFGRKINAKLIVSNEGLEYCNLFYQLNTKWQDIQGLNRYYISLLDPNGAESLRLSHSEIHQNLEIIQWIMKSEGVNLKIPISDFAWRWRSSDLGKLIQDNAIKMNYWFIDK